LGGLGSVFILQDFEQVMELPELRSLFFYTPLIAAMAGNVGVQSSAIIVQGLANNVVKGSLISLLFKEVGLSLINGLALALILIAFGQIIRQDLSISLTIAGSMMGVIVIAALIGTFVPIILNKRGLIQLSPLDPLLPLPTTSLVFFFSSIWPKSFLVSNYKA
jgi:magnesium transporter